MKNIVLILALILQTLLLQAQNKEVTLEDFSANHSFAPKRISGLRSMQDGAHYTVLEEGGTKIVKYSYATGKETTIIAEIPKLKETPIQTILDYQFSEDETKLLVFTQRENIYRRSFTADYYVIDIKRKEIEPLSESGKEQVATFSPDGYKVAYVKKNNLFIKNLRFGTTTQITTDGENNKIINGIPDWVYEEEFSFNRAFDWSPNSDELAYVKFDETEVKEFSFPVYKASFPSHEENELYPGEYSFKYPKAGLENSKVSVHVYHLRNRTTKTMDLGEETDIYIPRIKWTTQPDQLSILRLNRWQNSLDLIIANPSSEVTRVIFTDRNERYISEKILDNIYFLDDGDNFVYVGELDGFNHIHLYTMAGAKVKQITSGKWDVTKYYGYNEKLGQFFFQAAAKSPMQREVYSIRKDGSKMTRLTPNDGFNEAWFSDNMSYFIHEFSNTTTPPVFSVLSNAGKQIRTIEENKALKEKLKEYELPQKEFFSFKDEMGTEFNGWMMKPTSFDASKKHPLLMTQYSGPNSQEVLDKWGMDWSSFLPSKGYVVASVDGRGTGARGEEFTKQVYMQLGNLESDDQISAAQYLGTLPYIDKERIGIWGWSFGGYMTTMAMSKSDLFRTGISVAPITDWKFYDTAYTERFMRSPKENPKGYALTSSLELAPNLNGRLFLIHSTADDNVHLQNTLEYADRLVQEGKQFDMFIYPNRNHSIYGGNTRKHLYNMMFEYLEKNLKE